MSNMPDGGIPLKEGATLGSCSTKRKDGMKVSSMG